MRRIVKMGLFFEAATAWNNMCDVTYILDIARNGTMKRIELSFLAEDFPHLAGMQYARDVDFGMRPAEYYGDQLLPALLSGQMDDTKIEKSRMWERISGRLNAIVNLQETLDGDFVIASFDKTKVKGYSQLNAHYVIKSLILEEMYFVFLDERSGRYYCKSAFKKEKTDYVCNQAVMTMLQKNESAKRRSKYLVHETRLYSRSTRKS